MHLFVGTKFRLNEMGGSDGNVQWNENPMEAGLLACLHDVVPQTSTFPTSKTLFTQTSNNSRDSFIFTVKPFVGHGAVKRSYFSLWFFEPS
jgi:hypothetical protein